MALPYSAPGQLLMQPFATQPSKESHVFDDMWISDIVFVRMLRRKPNVSIKMLKSRNQVQRGWISPWSQSKLMTQYSFLIWRSTLHLTMTLAFTLSKPFARFFLLLSDSEVGWHSHFFKPRGNEVQGSPVSFPASQVCSSRCQNGSDWLLFGFLIAQLSSPMSSLFPFSH